MSAHPSPESDDFLFDARLRALYDAPGEEAAAPPPSPESWAGVEARLRPVAPRPGRPLAAGLMGAVVGVLLMGWWNHGTAPRLTEANTVANTTNTITSTPNTVTGSLNTITSPTNTVATSTHTPASVPNTVASAINTITSSTNTVAASTNTVATTLNTPATQMLPSLANAPATPAPTSGAPQAAGSVPETMAAAGSPPIKATGQVMMPTVVLTVGGFHVTPPTVLLPLIQAEITYADLAPPVDSGATVTATETRRAALLAERAALLALTHRADSLLLALNPPPAADSVATAPQAPAVRPSRWSVLVAGAPERSFLGLQAPTTDTLAALRRTHEQGRGGWNVALLAEYRLSPRWSVAAGGGLSTVGAELRLTDRQTQVAVTYDTTTTHTQQSDQVTSTSYIVQQVPAEPILTPRYNLSGQVVGFDTIPRFRPDTVWTVTSSTLLTDRTTKTVTPLIARHEVVKARILRPNYRFLTVPLLVRYRLGRATDWTSSPTAPRWWADVAVGTQLQWFMGGTHLMATENGRTFTTERVGRHDAAFRPFNVALLGQVAFNYALSSRWSASLAPTVRWQVQSVYRPSTGLTQRPTTTGVQLGVRYSF